MPRTSTSMHHMPLIQCAGAVQVTTPHSITPVGASSVLFLGVVPQQGAAFANSLVSVSASQCYAVHRLGTMQELLDKQTEDAKSAYVLMVSPELGRRFSSRFWT
jgi:hypothetical protein